MPLTTPWKSLAGRDPSEGCEDDTQLTAQKSPFLPSLVLYIRLLTYESNHIPFVMSVDTQ